jgi:hypothetical protein
MAARTDIQLTLRTEDFLEIQGAALRRPNMREAAARAVERATELVAPAAVYDYFRVLACSGTEVRVDRVTFNLGRHAALLAAAQEVLLAVVTIGPRLEEEARVLQKAGQVLDAYLLGEAGVYAVGELVERCHRIVEAEAASRGWGVGAELAPGQLAGWAIGEQRLLCSLLDVASIGVSVTDAGVLVPQKSASVMIGMGPDYESAVVHSPCMYCAMGDTCRFRH